MWSHTTSIPIFLAAVPFTLASNDALHVNTNTQNDKHAALHITTWGSDFYFAIMSVMGATALAILAASYKKPRSDRVFFYLCSGICMIATVAYFSMGSNLGWTPIDVEWVRRIAGVNGRNREIFYVRYIDWFLTTPLLLLDLLLTAGLPWPTILWTIFLDELMIVMGLVGALVKTRYKWGFYAFGCAAMLGVFYELAFVGRRCAKSLGNDVHRVYLMCGVLTLFIWCLYPIAWGLCEGGNVITPNDEAVFYGCLDFIAKPIFSIALIYGHWNIKPDRLGLRIMEADELVAIREKRNGTLQRNGHEDGVSTAHAESP